MRLIFLLGLGLVLGASGFNLTAPAWFLELSHIASGVFLFIAGWELEFLELRSHKKFFGLTFVGSFFVPFVVSYLVFENLFLAVALSISALPVAVQILKEKGLYGTSFSREAITLASLCDLLAWVVLAFLIPTANLTSWIVSHWVVGAFFVGLAVGRFIPFKRARVLLPFQAWVIAPLFFVGLGWKIDLLGLFDFANFIALFVIAILTKLAGTTLFAIWAGHSRKNAFQLAAILNARGAMEILAAQVAYQSNLINGPTFASLVTIGLTTSVLATLQVPSSQTKRRASMKGTIVPDGTRSAAE